MTKNKTKRLKTERLVLRKFHLVDFFYMLTWYIKPYISRYSQGESKKSVKQLVYFLLNKVKHYITDEEFYFWAVSIKGRPVGFIGLLNMRVENYYSFFYSISEDYSSKGYITEGVLKVIDYMKTQKAEYLYISCDKENTPSRRVIEKCGFEFEYEKDGDFHYPDGRIGDRLVYKMKIKD